MIALGVTLKTPPYPAYVFELTCLTCPLAKFTDETMTLAPVDPPGPIATPPPANATPIPTPNPHPYSQP